MGNIIIDIQANLNKLKKELKDVFKKSYKVDVSPRGRGGSGGGSRTGGAVTGGAIGGALGAMFKGLLIKLAPLVVLYKILEYFKVLDLIANFAMLGVLKIVEYVKALFRWGLDLRQRMLKWLSPIWDYLKSLWDSTKELAKVLWESLKETWGKITEWLKFGWDLIKQVIGTVWDILKNVWGAITNMASRVWEGLKTVWDVFKEVGTQIWDRLKEVWTNITDFVKSTIKPILDKVQDFIAKVWQGIKDLPSKIWGFMEELPTLIGSAIMNALPNIGQGVSNLFGKVTGRGTTSVNDAIFHKDGRVTKLNPNDTLFASKNPNGMGGGGTTVNLYGVTQREMLDYVKKELGKQINTVGRY